MGAEFLRGGRRIWSSCDRAAVRAVAGHGERELRTARSRSAGARVAELAAEYGTPLFVYDEAHLRARCREAVAAFGDRRVIYATKAFLCRAMARLAHEEGLLLDVASGGELHVALAAGVPAAACTFHGNNKSVDELRDGDRRAACATSSSTASTSSTGSTRSTPRASPAPRRPAARHARRARPHPRVHRHRPGRLEVRVQPRQRRRRPSRRAGPPVGVGRTSSALHCHIGSNVFAAGVFAKAAEVMAELRRPARPARAGARRRPRRRLRRGRGGADASPSGATRVLDAVPAAGRARRR